MLSSLPPQCGTLSRCRTLVSSIANAVAALRLVAQSLTEGVREIGDRRV
jgi:hypothetical protein